MLLEFSVSNFRCFHRRQTLNLAASGQDKTLPENCIVTDQPSVKNKRWVKGVALYGANASGKTTVIDALKALTSLVLSSAKVTDPKEPIAQVEPFALAPGAEKIPTAFAVTFITEGTRYEYRVAATRERVWHESLRAFPDKREQTWFSRDWNPQTSAYAWTPERPTGFQRDTQLEGYTLPNMLFLSKAVASNRTDLEPVFRWFKNRLQFLNLSAKADLGAILGESFTLSQIERDSPLKHRIVQMLRHADLGITGARSVEQRLPKGILEALLAPAQEQLKQQWRQPELTHQGKENEQIALPWESESAGTHRFFALAGPWLDIISNGYVVCIDELETSMHPLMVRELLRLIFSENENPHGAQIIFTTHNPLLLDTTFMRRDQVWFADKDQFGEAHLYPLTDYAPRKQESLIRGYLSGRYNAVPFVPRGLTGAFPSHQVEEVDAAP